MSLRNFPEENSIWNNSHVKISLPRCSFWTWKCIFSCIQASILLSLTPSGLKWDSQSLQQLLGLQTWTRMHTILFFIYSFFDCHYTIRFFRADHICLDYISLSMMTWDSFSGRYFSIYFCYVVWMWKASYNLMCLTNCSPLGTTVLMKYIF